MTEERIRIVGPPEVLERLRGELRAALGQDAEVESVSSAVPGELREPVLIGLLISFSSTAAVAIRTAGSILERRMTYLERRELLRIYRERDDVEISPEEMLAEILNDE